MAKNGVETFRNLPDAVEIFNDLKDIEEQKQDAIEIANVVASNETTLLTNSIEVRAGFRSSEAAQLIGSILSLQTYLPEIMKLDQAQATESDSDCVSTIEFQGDGDVRHFIGGMCIAATALNATLKINALNVCAWIDPGQSYEDALGAYDEACNMEFLLNPTRHI